MPNAAIHPTPQELTAFARGKLADAAAVAVARHLETCPECRKALESLSADSFIGKLRAARPGVSSLPARPGEAAKIPSSPLKDLPPDLANYNKYRFVRELGRGGMGVVYQAEQTVMGRIVAVKVINPSVLDHPDALPRFQSEVKAAAKLDHPNIVRAHDAEQVGSMHLLVMEYVEGTSLAELVMKKGPLSVPYACHYVRQAALGLHHAFEQGMVHRDIKPQNLMVNARGQVKVLDFGLARMRSERKAGGGLTQADAFMGTPEYVSPEQATDARNADTRADIYSLGCTLFFLLTGRPPFQEDTLVKLVLAQIEKEPPLLRDVRADVPTELSAVVSRMLAKDPAARFQTPLEVAQALAVFVKAGAKTPAGVSALAPGVSSPAMGTAIEANTSQIKAILRDAPGKSPAAEAQPFEGLREADPAVPKASRKAAQSSSRAWYRRGPVWARLVAALLALALGAWLLAGIVFKTRVKTPDGEAFVVLEIDQGDAEVTVDGHKINVQVPGDNKPVQIQLEPGRPHKLRVSKDGFEVFGRDVELQSGKSASIRVKLEPVKSVAAVPRPVDVASPQRTPTDYDALAKGRWIALLPSIEEFNRLQTVEVNRELKTRPTFVDGVLACDHTSMGFPHIQAKDVIVRASIKKSGRSARGNVALWLRNLHSVGKEGLTAWFNGSTFGIGRVRNQVYRDIKLCQASEPYDGYFEFAFAAIGNKLIAYANGRKVLEVRDNDALNRNGGIMVAGARCLGWLKNIEVQVLDKPSADEKGFVSLFNGKDLTGWKTHPRQPGNWRVENGVLVGSGRPLSHLYSDRGDYRNFHLRLEARINANGDSGVDFRTGFGPDSSGKYPGFPSGYEVQIRSSKPGDTGQTGSLFVSAGPPLGEVRASPGAAGKWFTMELIAEDNHFVIKVNGQTTMDYTDKNRRFRSGHIALQQFDVKTVAEFRKIEIKELPAK